MADINFDCPHCGQNLDASDDMAGWALDCPMCGGKLKVPVPEGATPEHPIDASSSTDKATTGLIDQNADEDSKKGSTARIELPSDFVMPAPSHRIVKIKRIK